jgi:hypothetical protein
MFPNARLKFLQQRKQELLTASEVQRQLLAAECATVKRRLEWLDCAVNATRRFAPFLGLVAPLLQAWSASRSDERSWFTRITDALPIASRVAGAVQQLMQR